MGNAARQRDLRSEVEFMARCYRAEGIKRAKGSKCIKCDGLGTLMGFEPTDCDACGATGVSQ